MKLAIVALAANVAASPAAAGGASASALRPLPPARKASVQLLFQRRHRHDADALIDERLGFRRAGLAANGALGLLAVVDGARDLGKTLADVVRILFDLAPELRHHFAHAPALVVGQGLRLRLRWRPIGADDGGRHDRLVYLSRTAFGAKYETALPLNLVSRAVVEPAVEVVSVGAMKRVFDHFIPPASRRARQRPRGRRVRLSPRRVCRR